MLDEWKKRFERFQDEVENEGYRKAIGTTSKFIINQTSRRVIRPISRSLSQPIGILLHSYFTDRLNMFNKQWDLLIICDTCRPDALRRVSDEYPFVRDIKTRWSVGSSSPEWVYNTFDEKYQEDIRQTAYVTSNPFSWAVLENGYETDQLGRELSRERRRLPRYSVTSPVNSDELHTFISLWNPSENYGPVKYPSPRSVTDHVISLDRSEDSPPRIIAHYMPPHTPYIAQKVDGEIEFTDEPRNGLSFKAYTDNLRWALNEVSLLINNVDREKVVITADHGENFNLRLIRSNHIDGMVSPAVRRVPWAQTAASDDQTYKPEFSEGSSQECMSPDETLEALGYLP